MANLIDMTGQRYGRLVVLSCAGRSLQGKAKWNCLCDCGKELIVHACPLRDGRTRSCGCLRNETTRRMFTTHGLRSTLRYHMLHDAKKRAQKKHVPFSLTLDTMPVIPATCEVLGIPLHSSAGEEQSARRDISPSLDRIVPNVGYVPGNVRIISYRANEIKNNATLQELAAVTYDSARHVPLDQLILQSAL